MLTKTISFALAAASLSTAPAAFAQEQPIALTTSTYLVDVTEAGEELAPATSVVPGDMLEFTTRFANQTTSVITEFTVTNPVPRNVMLTADAATATEVSVDGGTVWGPLSALEIMRDDGTRRNAMPDDVTHMRWVIATLAPAETGSVSYRAVVR